MLAYVFWHRPTPRTDPTEYEARLSAFHAALAADPPDGFGGSCALRLDAAPWLPGASGTPSAYEDWYLVPDWAALGELNVHAVSGSRSAPHDAAAALVGSGIAGVYALIQGPAEPPTHAHGAWMPKPAGMTYDDFHAALPAGATVWQRQMTLGPAGEYTVRAAAPLDLPWPATPVELHSV